MFSLVWVSVLGPCTRAWNTWLAATVCVMLLVCVAFDACANQHAAKCVAVVSALLTPSARHVPCVHDFALTMCRDSVVGGGVCACAVRIAHDNGGDCALEVCYEYILFSHQLSTSLDSLVEIVGMIPPALSRKKSFPRLSLASCANECLRLKSLQCPPKHKDFMRL